MEVTRSLQLRPFTKPLTTAQITTILLLQSHHTYTHRICEKSSTLSFLPMNSLLKSRVILVRRKGKNLPARLSCHPLHVSKSHSQTSISQDAALQETLLKAPKLVHQSHSARLYSLGSQGGLPRAGQWCSQPQWAGQQCARRAGGPQLQARPPPPWKYTAVVAVNGIWHWWRGSWLLDSGLWSSFIQTKQPYWKTLEFVCESSSWHQISISKAAKPS